MVSKIAVIALVGILAVPILLGYALNLEQVTEIDYKNTDDTVNVTPLLQSGTSYTYAMADIYKLNTEFHSQGQKILPLYERVSGSKSSFPLYKASYTNQSWQGAYQAVNFKYFYEQFDYDPATNHHHAIAQKVVNGVSQDLFAMPYIRSFYYENTTGYYQYQLYQNGGYNTVEGTAQIDRIMLWTYSGTTDVYVENYDPALYVDFSDGFRFKSGLSNIPSVPYTKSIVNLPDYSKSALLTIDLSSVTDSSYRFDIGGNLLTKTTTDGVVKWTVSDNNSSTDYEPFELYYEQGSSNNTYQIRYTVDVDAVVSVGSGMYSYPALIDFKYVGAWPKIIGEANYFHSYTVEQSYLQVGRPNFNALGLGGYAALSPKIRIDAAEFRAFENPIIDNKTYDPASFKSNPSTTINNPVIYGPSFEFGGNTYTVKNGNITMGSHQVPVKGLVLSSVPNPEGGYDNKIGNTVISNTAVPSAITFNGKWSASITTTTQEEYDVTKTEWKAGSFAWDGIDQNFLMVGLLASLGAFVALGIYARRSRASIWPLMLVCGGAALLFFVML